MSRIILLIIHALDFLHAFRLWDILFRVCINMLIARAHARSCTCCDIGGGGGGGRTLIPDLRHCPLLHLRPTYLLSFLPSTLPSRRKPLQINLQNIDLRVGEPGVGEWGARLGPHINTNRPLFVSPLYFKILISS